MLFFKGCGGFGSVPFLRERSVLLVGSSITAQCLVVCHAGFEVFHYGQRFMELGVKLCNSLVECVLVEQTFLLQKNQGLRHGFEVVLLRPTLIADALALLQFCLNVHQLLDSVGFFLKIAVEDNGLALGIFFQGGKHEFFLKLVTEAVRPDKLLSSGWQVAEPPTAFLDRDAVLLQEPVREIFKARCIVQHIRDLFPQSLLCGFKLRLCRLLSGGKQGSVFTVEFHLTAPFHPVFTLAHTLFRAEQVDLVQLGILTHFHDCDTQVPHGLGCAGMLHALAPVAGLLHIGLAFHFSCSDAADHDVDVDVSRMVVPIRVSADDGRMTGEVFFAEFQAKCLCLFHGQAVVGCISWVKADDILVTFDITMLGILTILAVCQQTSRCKREIATLKGVEQVRIPQLRLALFIQKLLSGERVVLVNEVRFDGGVVRVFRGDMLERCHTVHPELSRR